MAPTPQALQEPSSFSLGVIDWRTYWSRNRRHCGAAKRQPVRFRAFVFSTEFLVLSWAIATSNSLVYASSALAITWLGARRFDGPFVALIQVATFAGSVLFAPLLGIVLQAIVATLVTIYLAVLTKIIGIGEVPPLHVGEILQSGYNALPALGSIPAHSLAFWPSLGHEYGLTPNSLLASSVLTWVRLGIAGIFLSSWLIVPLTYRFAYLNLRSLLELEKPALTVIAVAVSGFAKAMQEVVKALVK